MYFFKHLEDKEYDFYITFIAKENSLHIVGPYSTNVVGQIKLQWKIIFVKHQYCLQLELAVNGFPGKMFHYPSVYEKRCCCIS